MEPAAPPPPAPPHEHRRNLSTYQPHSSHSDGFLSYIAGLLRHSFVLADSFPESANGTMHMLEKLIAEHVGGAGTSKLRKLVPTLGPMHTPLALVEAFSTYDAKYQLTKRTHVPPAAWCSRLACDYEHQSCVWTRTRRWM